MRTKNKTIQSRIVVSKRPKVMQFGIPYTILQLQLVCYTLYLVFSLESIRSTLIRQEETIIFSLIERAQYRRNSVIYDPQVSNTTSFFLIFRFHFVIKAYPCIFSQQFKFRNVYDAPISFLEWMLIETEKLHAKVRRFSYEEHSFFPHVTPEMTLAFSCLITITKFSQKDSYTLISTNKGTKIYFA